MKATKAAAKGKPALDRACVHRKAFAHLKPVTVPLESGVVELPDYVGMALGYVDAVLKRKVPENEFIILACRRFRQMYDDAKAGNAPFYWDDMAVIAACDFIESLPQVQGAENDGDLLALEPVWIWIIAAIFGFRHLVGNKSVRWCNEAFIDIPRKSAKSTVAAGIDLYIFLYEDEVGSEIYLAASTREQSKKVFNPLRGILNRRKDLVLEHSLKVTTKEVRKPDGGFVTTISAQGRKEDGHNPHVAHIDELHATPQALHDVMDSSLGSRANQLFLKTTTAGTRAAGPGFEERRRAERVLRGQETAPRYFCAIWTIDADDQKNPLTWENVVKANPMLGISVSISKVKDDLEQAKFSPSKRAELIVKRLNVYAQSAAHAISPLQWAQCERKMLRWERFKGKKGWLGVDLSSHDDQTALGLIFEHSEPDFDDLLAVFAWHFLPEESPAFENDKIEDDLRDWVENGELTVTEGPIVDYDAVQAKIEWLCGLFDIEAVVFDRAHSIQMVGNLNKKGIKAGIIAANAIELSEPTKDLVSRARYGRLRHDGNRILAWNAQNTLLTPGDLWRPVKDRTAPHLKIDGFSALTHANVARFGRVQHKTEKPKKRPFNPNHVVGNQPRGNA
jgi:phage terminase large subunit-like protein